MGEQHLMGAGPLLNENGDLAEPGYAFSLVKTYDRSAIRLSKWRIKEWDYYYVGNKDYGCALTVADNGYMWLCSISILDFKNKKEITKSPMGWFPFGKLKLPRDSRIGNTAFCKDDKFSFEFRHEGKKRRLLVYMKDFGGKGKDFRSDITLEETVGKSMVIATPFRKKGHFYYNQKINNMAANGYAKVGEETYGFHSGSYGVLDWGRGTWTYRNTWLWSSCSSEYAGHTIGWNLGYGFGDTSKASENMVFLDDKAYKLDEVKMDIPLDKFGHDDFMSPWKFRSPSHDIDMTFTPIYDRHADTNVGIIRSNQHQVFGRFSGHFLLDGKSFYFEDLPGFAEKVFNKW